MPSILLHSAPHPLPDPPTVAGLLAGLNRDPKKVAVEVNEEVVPRERHSTTELREGDRVEIVTLVGGRVVFCSLRERVRKTARGASRTLRLTSSLSS